MGSLMSGIKSGDIVNWRTTNGRGNPCSRRAEVYFAPQSDTVMLYVYGLKNLKRVPLSEVRAIRTAQPKVEAVAETVKRMDCPSVMREHLWSIEREGMIECLWCFQRRRSEDRERHTVRGQRLAQETPPNA